MITMGRHATIREALLAATAEWVAGHPHRPLDVSAGTHQAWHSLRYAGDGECRGRSLWDAATVRDLLRAWPGPERDTDGRVKLFVYPGRRHARPRENDEEREREASRMDTAKALFEAFANRCIAYDAPLAVGVTQFATEITHLAEPTQLFEKVGPSQESGMGIVPGGSLTDHVSFYLSVHQDRRPPKPARRHRSVGRALRRADKAAGVEARKARAQGRQAARAGAVGRRGHEVAGEPVGCGQRCTQRGACDRGCR